MGVTESNPDVTGEVITLCVDALVIALVQRGLAAEPISTAMVWAKNSAADPPGAAPSGSTSPFLSQTVVCRPSEAGQLSWFWVWPGPVQGAPSELEYLGPAAHIGETAGRVANVLRLSDAGLGSAT